MHFWLLTAYSYEVSWNFVQYFRTYEQNDISSVFTHCISRWQPLYHKFLNFECKYLENQKWYWEMVNSVRSYFVRSYIWDQHVFWVNFPFNWLNKEQKVGIHHQFDIRVSALRDNWDDCVTSVVIYRKPFNTAPLLKTTSTLPKFTMNRNDTRRAYWPLFKLIPPPPPPLPTYWLKYFVKCP